MHIDEQQRHFLDTHGCLEQLLMEHTLVRSYEQFKERGENYPFFAPRGMRPGARGFCMLEDQVEAHNEGLVFLCEKPLGPSYRKNLLFEADQRVTKDNLLDDPIQDSAYEHFVSRFKFSHTYVVHERFADTLKQLLRLDYGILIQPQRSDPKGSADDYGITHYGVEVDWPVYEAVEGMGKRLGLIDDHAFECGERFAEKLKKKFFEYHGFHKSAGGRRTAATIATELLHEHSGEFSVYVASAGERTLTRLTRQGIAKHILVPLTEDMISGYREIYPDFEEAFLARDNVAIFRAVYQPNHQALRLPFTESKSKHWLSLTRQELVPFAGPSRIEAVPCHLVYKGYRGDVYG